MGSSREQAKETTSVTKAARYPDALWTSADRYARYGATAKTLDANLSGKGSVLDVGDPSGYLALFADTYELVCADLNTDQTPLPETIRLIASGAGLPFADGSFDAVISNDALEHVPADVRDGFLKELNRVAKDLVIVAAPFDTAGVYGAEEFVRRFAFVSTGVFQDQLEEHAERGLPDLDETVAVFAGEGSKVETFGNGNLEDWVLSMLMKHQSIARSELAPLDQGGDILYSAMFDERNDVGPFYRHLVVASKVGNPKVPITQAANSSPSGSSGNSVSSFLAAVIAANSTEAARADIAATRANFDLMHQRLDGDFSNIYDSVGVGEGSAAAQIAELRGEVSQLAASVARFEHKIDAAIDAIKHPLSSLRRKGRDSNDGD